MALDATAIETGVIIAALVGAGGAARLYLNRGGRRLCTRLGTVEMRTVAVIASAAALLAITSLILQIIQQRPEVSIASRVIMNTDGTYNFHQTNGFVRITDNSDDEICTISMEATSGGGDCTIRRVDDHWEGSANLGPTCQFTCFKFSLSK